MVLSLLFLLAIPAFADQLATLVEIQGVRGHTLQGFGLVVGLAGTGDKQPAAVAAQQQILDRYDIDVGSVSNLTSQNTALVSVKATLPAFAKEGTRFDVEQVSSIGDAKSLEGGALLMTQLKAIDGNTYAIAEGPISVGGFNADAGGANVRQNHVLVGRIPMGANVEREVPSRFTDGDRIVLLLKRPDFRSANVINAALNQQFGPDTAAALGGGTISVHIPVEKQANVESFIAQVLDMNVEIEAPARVVINERTGTIVLGGDVMVKPCQVAHGNLTITVARTPQVSQPNPFAAGETVVTETVDLSAEQEIRHMMPLGGVSARKVAQALNKLKVTPRDMISIFQALREVGSLEADIEIM